MSLSLRESGKSSLGGLISVLTVCVSCYLFYHEYKMYQDVRLESKLSVDTISADETFFASKKISVNIDVVFEKVPCELLTFDAADVMGNRDVQAKGHLFKEKIGGASESVQDATERTMYAFNWQTPQQIESINELKSRINKEGCRLKGQIWVNTAPGHLHIGTIFIDGVKADPKHQINELSFGGEKTEPELEFESRIDSHNGLAGYTNTQDGTVFEYYLKVVGKSFIELSGRQIGGGYDYSVSKNVIQQGFMPSVYFRYDFIPVKVEYREMKESVFSFVVRVFAIIGGIAGVMRLLGVVLTDTVEAVRHKNRIGKLI